MSNIQIKSISIEVKSDHKTSGKWLTYIISCVLYSKFYGLFKCHITSTVSKVAVEMFYIQNLQYFFSEGVLYVDKCSSTNLDHSVLLVGYGVEKGEPYWLIKNSWSTYWGDQGYIKLSQKDNNCGVTTQAVYANPVSGAASFTSFTCLVGALVLSILASHA